MKILFDTNILIDVLQKRDSFYPASFEVFMAVANEQVEGVITATTITDIIYIMRKHLNQEKAFDVLHKLLGLFTICDVRKDDLLYAISLDAPDYEDAVQAACAHRIKADYIVTRDRNGFKKSSVKALAPQDIIKAIGDKNTQKNE